MIYSLFIVLAILSIAYGKIYFQEDFNDAAWKSRWTVSSEWKPKHEMGEWKWTPGQWHDSISDKGIQTSEDARFYGISAKLNEAFSNKGKDLVLQFSVKHEQDLDCGGAYIKLMGDIDQKKFGGETPYQIMFGPDVCGSTKRTHAIFHYGPKNDNLLIKNELRTETDKLSHLYTLHIKSDNTFEVMIDEEVIRSGKLEEAWDFLLPREIKDPKVSKPADWVDVKKIPDPADVKPAGYDDVPKQIPDPDAKKPEDWDDEEDGEWEAPTIDNPEYKGPWKPKLIDNPAYKGEWVHPMIPNPDFAEDPNLHARCDKCTHIGFELWQVRSGTLFDDIIVTDSLAEAKEFAAKTFHKKQAGEKQAYEAHEKAEREKASAAAAASSAETEDMEGEDEDRDEL